MRLPRDFFLYVFFCTLSFALLLSSIKITPYKFSAWRSFFLYLVSPVVWSADNFLKENFNLPKNIVETVRAREENALLKSKIAEMESAKMRYDALASENEFLRAALGLPQKPDYKYITAEVVMRDPNSWSLSCILNKGANSGIKRMSAVVTLQNGRFVLIGKIVDVFENSSEVMLLTNPMFSVPAQIPSSNCDGLLENLSAKNLVLNYPSLKSVPIGADVEVGPLSRIFPPGILIGTVVDNRNQIVVSPEFLKNPLNTVIVIVNYAQK